MRYFFIFLTITITINVCGQSLEERAATLACECIKKQEHLDNAKYRECLSKSLVAAQNESNDFSISGTVEGIQSAFLKVQSILSYTCNVLSEKELEAKRERFYSDSKNEFAQNSYIIGNDMMNGTKFDLAIESFGLALSVDSTFVLALDHTAICYKQLGDLENAVKYYNKSLDVYPEGDLALMNIGVIYTSVGEFEISNKYYLRLANLYPNNPEGFFGLAKNYILLGEFEKGLENISIAYQIYKKTKSAYTKDVEKIVEIVRQTMKENDQESEFKKIAKKYGLKAK
jgi:tetratricopeptide (TPR) repeat protein